MAKTQPTTEDLRRESDILEKGHIRAYNQIPVIDTRPNQWTREISSDPKPEIPTPGQSPKSD
jgi:hypothetical protein